MFFFFVAFEELFKKTKRNQINISRFHTIDEDILIIENCFVTLKNCVC